MLEQIVYTRCSPHRLLHQGGSVSHKEGLGIASLSRGLVHLPVDLYFVESRLVNKNASDDLMPELGLFHSYELNTLSDGQYQITFEYAREYCSQLRKNGVRNRRGTFVKQSLVGRLEGYPYQWFGAQCWNAWKRAENDYYLDDLGENREPEDLPQVQASPVGGYLDREQIRQFVKDGRGEALKTCVYFLLRELEQPEKERRVLIILDYPQEVEKWVAAIECCFSEEMARQVSFATNRTNLLENKKNILFYYADRFGRMVRSVEGARGAELSRRPYCMVIGCHPNDSACSFNARETKDYVVLNGVNRQMCLSAEMIPGSRFFTDVGNLDERLNRFYQTARMASPLSSMNLSLVKVYDAMCQVLGWDERRSPARTKAYENLSILTGTEWADAKRLNTAFLRYGLQTLEGEIPLDELQVGGRILDLLAGLELDEACKRQLKETIEDMLRRDLDDLGGKEAHLTRLWQSVVSRKNLAVYLCSVLEYLLREQQLRALARGIEETPEAADTLLRMLLWYVDEIRMPQETLLDLEQKTGFLSHCVHSLVNQGGAAASMGAMRRYPELFYSVFTSVSMQLPENRKREWYTDVLMQNDINATDLCEKLLDNQLSNPNQIEEMLAYLVESGRCECTQTGDMFAALCEKAGGESRGLRYFSACIRKTPRFQWPALIRRIRAETAPGVQKELLDQMDWQLPIEAAQQEIPLYREVVDWGDELRIAFPNSLLGLFYGQYLTAQPECAVSLLQGLALRQIQVEEGFERENYYQTLLKKTMEFSDSGAHVLALSLFVMSEETHLRLVVSYVERCLYRKRRQIGILDLTSQKWLAQAFLSLQAGCYLRFQGMESVLPRIQRTQELLNQRVRVVWNREGNRKLAGILLKEGRRSMHPGWERASRELTSGRHER